MTITPIDQRKKCPTCQGEGEIPDNTGNFVMVLCPKCKGQGWVPKT